MSYGTLPGERAYRADVHAEETAAASHSEREAAAVEVLEADAHWFSDWLYGKCYGHTAVTFYLAPRDDAVFADFISTLNPAELLAYAMQHALAYPLKAAACMELLRSMYVNEHMHAKGWTGSY